MKIVINIECCQTEAGTRGMGRYSLHLARELVRQGKAHDFMFLVNARYLPSSRDLVNNIEAFASLGNIVYYDYPGLDVPGEGRFLQEQVANLLRNDRVDTLSPDIYHVSSLFEGESVFGPSPAVMRLPSGPLVRSATLYDFIPQLFAEQYLTNGLVAAWYRRTINVARELDVGLAISDATRRDAASLLNSQRIKITNISGAADDIFAPTAPEVLRTSAVINRVTPNQPYLLYVGGPDFRKNMDGMLSAFAEAQSVLQGRYSLVIVYQISNAEAADLRGRIYALGLSNLVVFTGFVTDEDLVQLYAGCSLFMFPSLYEGLGLPVIEAMRCGAPVLVGDNSSLIEMIPEAEYRFDAADPKAIAEALTEALVTPGRLEAMRALSIKRAEGFSWENSARLALDTWEAAYQEVRAMRTKPHGKEGARARIAVFTPLPPAKSGIADYSADLLPTLAKYAAMDVFVEDVTEVGARLDNIRLWHHSEFDFQSESFDAIIYQIGNSPFHHYMLPYIQRHPGVVVLHDAYLGHLFHDPGDPGSFARHIIRDHGPPARAVIKQNESLAKGALDAILRLTCSRQAVHRAIGVIVHSRFAHDLLKTDARLSTAAEIAVIQQFAAPVEAARTTTKDEARDELGIPRDQVVIASFGHVAYTKGALELIEAFKISEGGRSGKARLIFVGELEGGPEAATSFAKEALRALEGETAIAVTGYVSQEVYNLYILATDIGVQLRTVTRGETSRSILNVLANGVPLIVNRLGASSELPADAVLEVASLAPAGIARSIDQLIYDPDKRAAFAKSAAQFAATTLNANVIASEMVATVLSMTKRAAQCGPRALIDGLTTLLADRPAGKPLLREIAAAYINQEMAESEPRLLIDVSHIREADLKTGVQRVVREVTRATYTFPDSQVRPQTFAFTAEGLIFADDYAQSCGARLPVEESLARAGALTPRPFDKMLLADGTWHLTPWMHEPLEALNAMAGSAYGLVHDILPLLKPDLFHAHVTQSINKWLTLLLEKGAGLVCTSRTSADLLVEYIISARYKVRPKLRVGYAKLGSDIALGSETGRAILRSTENVLTKNNIFLVVSTLEPRKGHAYILDAFETLWKDKVDATLVFVGKAGWDTETLLKRIDNHPMRGKRFFSLGFTPDADLCRLYEGATAVVMASTAEGFGLPIYEAAHFGTPLLLSDLPVFKEIAGDHAAFFAAGSAESLAQMVKTAVQSPGRLKSSKAIDAPSWAQCTADIISFMHGRNTYYQF